MENKGSYNLDEVYAKRENISTIFSKNVLGSIIHFLVLMMLGCDCTRRAGAGFERNQKEVGYESYK